MASCTDGPSQQRAAASQTEITGGSSSSINVINVPLIKSDEFAELVQKVKNELFTNVMDGNWDAVVKIYTKHKVISQRSVITKSKETALHIAIMDNKTEEAKKLLKLVDANAIRKMKNKRENNPLHLAAARGQVEICKLMMEIDEMEIDETLIKARNKDGETPLFLAALHGKKGAFYSLHRKCTNSGLHIVHDISLCRRNLDGNSILHVAILGEYFELAYQIIHWYPDLSNKKNEKGQSPLEFLAKNPSAFRSGCHLGPLDGFIYNCSTVDKLKPELPSDIKEQSPKSNDPVPENYRACFDLFEILRKATKIFFAYRNPLNACRKEEEDIENLPSRTQSKFPMTNQSEVHMEKKDEDVEIQSSPVHCKCIPKRSKGKDMQQHEPEKETTQEAPPGCKHGHLEIVENTVGKDGSEMEGRRRREDFSASQLPYPTNYSTYFRFLEFLVELFQFIFGLGKEEKSPILVAAAMGVVEMVKEILQRFPVAIEDVNQDDKNVALLAVENRQPQVYTFLQKKYATNESVFLKLDKEGNSALHLAATLSNYRRWVVPGASLQVHWALKWFEFINVSMPRHFSTRLNNSGHTAKEVFAETHRKLVKDDRKWLIKTSQSCSVVAALIATVAFASATTVPGGVKEDRGTPTLEGKPAFDVFVISSFIALCFSVTSITMFLSILTSRYQVEDFHYRLPTKLIVGLSSLFISIAAMLVSFCAGHFFVLADRLKYIVLPMYFACLPLTLFAVAQIPLYFYLLESTMPLVPKHNYEVISL